MRLLGLDVGTKRIGVARADSKVKIAVPQCTISVDGTEFDQISRISRVYDAKFFVIGLPRGAEGQETEQSRYSRDFAKKLKQALPEAKICFQDESLTSVEAENRLKNRKKGYKKGDIDAEAATIILQDFLENFSGNGANTDSDVKKTSKLTEKFGKKNLIVAASIAISAILVGFLTFCLFNGSLAPVVEGVDCSTKELINKEPEICKERSVVVEDGMSVSEIADLLKERDLIRSPLSFKLYSILTGLAGNMKSGRYGFNKTVSAQEIAATIADGSAGVVTFRITTLPGGTLADFKEILLDNGYSESEINTAFSKKYDNPVLASKPENASLEGYIYGETIEFARGDSVESIIEKILDETYGVVVANDLEAKYAEHGLTLHEGIILASIVQKEAASNDMANVAGVFYNRLSLGMTLGSDVTVTYALDQVDPNRRTYTDNSAAFEVDSCYNTRKYAGLPCGPISNPGISALRAVANPVDSPYLYFLTGDDGVMYYSETEEGHQINVRDHCGELCSISL